MLSQTVELAMEIKNLRDKYDISPEEKMTAITLADAFDLWFDADGKLKPSLFPSTRRAKGKN